IRQLPHSTSVPYTTLFRSYQLLKTFGFSEWNDVEALLTAQPGKMVFSSTHRLIRDRDHLILTEVFSEKNTKGFKIEKGEEIVMRSEEHTSELQSRENLVCR